MNSQTLWQHQTDAIKRGILNEELALFMEMGTGKTRTVIEIIRRKYAYHNEILRTLILSPPVTLTNWKNEFNKYSKIPQDKILIANNDSKYKKSVVSRAIEMGSAIVITNYETLQSDEVFELIEKFRPQVIICDESQRLKNPKSKRSKKVLKLADADHCLYRYILSGTPILNNALDIFMQFRILDRGKTFGKNYFSFRGSYFEDVNAKWSGKPNYFPKFVPIVAKYPELSERIGQKSVVAYKSECLDLPPLIRMRGEVPLSKEQKRVYNELALEYVADVTSMLKLGKPHHLVTELAIQKSLRMQQILTGYIPTPKTALLESAKTPEEALQKMKQTEVVYFDDNPRAVALGELLEDITSNHKVIVWACFEPNYKTIRDVCRQLGVEFAELHGGVTGEKRELNIKNFRETESCRVLIANQQAGGVGINLIEASYAIYYSRNFSLEADMQSEARNHRGGSEMHEKVTRIDLVAPNTLDDKVLDALMQKKAIGDVLLSWNVADLLP